MSKVVGLHGVVPTSEPVPAVVELLEQLLMRARAGEIRAIAAAYALPEDIGGSAWETNPRSRNTVAAAILMLQYRYTAQMLGEPS